MIEYNDSLLSIGGLTLHGEINTISSLSCEARRCSWSKLNQELSKGRSAMVAVLGTDSMTNC